MPTQNASQIKERILSLLRLKGPSLPVHIARETGLSILFASAFLSELFQDKKIKMSNLRVGNSPLYFIQGQEPQLERFSEHLRSKEKDAFLLIKNKRFLDDAEQEPAIRVALREIKDFAIPFRKDEKIYWRYFTTPKTDINIEEKSIKENQQTPLQKSIIQKETTELDIFDKKTKAETKKGPKKVSKKKKTSQKANEKFFGKVKEFLDKKSIKILDIIGFNKNDLFLKIKVDEKELLLTAYNKKRISEIEIIKSYKKAEELGIDYMILSLGEIPKKLDNLMIALKRLKGIDKIT